MEGADKRCVMCIVDMCIVDIVTFSNAMRIITDFISQHNLS